MIKSENLNELALALSKAQGIMKGAVKDSNNPFFKSSYADLQSVWEAIREPLANNGLSVTQLLNYIDNKPTLQTLLLHSSGQFIGSEVTIPVTKSDPQSLGSAITYMRRYSLAAIVGLYQVDDDAESAMHRYQQDLQQSLVKPKTSYNAQNEPFLQDLIPVNIPDGQDEYIIPLGKFKGKRINEVKIDELTNYSSFIFKQAASENKSIDPNSPLGILINKIEHLKNKTNN